MAAVLVVNALCYGVGMVRERKWREFAVLMAVTVVGLSVCALLAAGVVPDLYGLVKGLLKKFR